ncbi:MAG: hypothetical protein JJD97_10505, partial [Gemmatimonadaceae bacterium]|nr:hypothetical protein [Gemmatimonadaceae bacterium]
VLGVRWSLLVSIAAMLVAFACFVESARLADRVGTDARAPIALAIAALAWLAVLVPWILRSPRMAPASHKRGMYAALGAWAVTDIAVLLATA